MNGAPTPARSESLKVGGFGRDYDAISLDGSYTRLSVGSRSGRHPGLIGRVVKCAFAEGGETPFWVTQKLIHFEIGLITAKNRFS